MKINPKLYHTLSWTWGIIMTLIGACAAAFFSATGHKAQKHGGAIYYEVGKKPWGGVNLGKYFFCSPGATKHTKDHEFGHSLQNCVWGPLFPFVIGIPSFVRCQKFNSNIKKGIPNEEDYYAIWFEKEASEWGEKVADQWPK